MKSYSFRKTAKFCLIAFTFTILLGIPRHVRSDVAPPEPPYGTNPMPGGEYTNVRMVAETVIMDVDSDTSDFGGAAKVTATFTMRNLGEDEEQMEVRFPLYTKSEVYENCIIDIPPHPGIYDLLVWVDGVSVETKTTYKTYTFEDASGKSHDYKTACWANFPVSFPVGKDVIIKVTFTAWPYKFYPVAEYIYTYVLKTGAGWKGTIGSADIIVRLPYELNQDNFISCEPDYCVISGNVVEWHYEDFEPDFWAVEVALVPPPIWLRILIERENTANNPSDGEAWGRLGKAYKEAIMMRRGIANIELYRLSVEAYQKAVTLLPNDADWHFGYAELLCQYATWNVYPELNLTASRSCIEQIKEALDINPQHERANQLLHEVAFFFTDMYKLEIIDLSGSKPDYLILTPYAISTNTKEPTSTIKPAIKPTTKPASTQIAAKISETIIPTKPSQTHSPTPIITAQVSFTKTPNQINTPMVTQHQISNIEVGGLMLLVLVGVVVLFGIVIRLLRSRFG